MARWTHVDEVRFGDTDLMGHVNNARFHSFTEDARIRMLSGVTTDAGRPLPEAGLILARAEMAFRRPLFLSEHSVVTELAVTRVGSSSVTIQHEITQDEQVCATGLVVVVAYDYDAGRSRPLSDDERAALEALRDAHAEG